MFLHVTCVCFDLLVGTRGASKKGIKVDRRRNLYVQLYTRSHRRRFHVFCLPYLDRLFAIILHVCFVQRGPIN
ncbi:hypothetical protein V8F20_010192 [Naviculisporaceae sp. PSN 640]